MALAEQGYIYQSSMNNRGRGLTAASHEILSSGKNGGSFW